jgi:threonine dehydrogenase-like Zn-dependent dehydrogenase
MSEPNRSELRVHIQATSHDVSALAGGRPFAVGRTGSALDSEGHRAETVLVRGTHTADSEVNIQTSECVVLAAPLSAGLAILVPPLASALALWETLRLELGDAVVWTTGHPLSALVGQVALWRGACPAIELGSPADARAHSGTTEFVDSAEQEDAAKRLARLVGARPGFAAVDLSGRADLIDTLLEVMPQWSRLLLAGPPGAPLTIDFYKNVHRKGATIACTTIEPSRVFDTHSDVQQQVRRACEILRNPRLAQTCQALLTPTGARAPLAIAG